MSGSLETKPERQSRLWTFYGDTTINVMLYPEWDPGKTTTTKNQVNKPKKIWVKYGF